MFEFKKNKVGCKKKNRKKREKNIEKVRRHLWLQYLPRPVVQYFRICIGLQNN